MPILSDYLIYKGEIPLPVIIWSIFIGIFIASIVTYIIKNKFGAFVRALIERKADSPETALSVSDLGMHGKLFVRIGLKMRSNYKNIMVAITEDGKYYANDHYTLTPPIFKGFVLTRRKTKKSKIKESVKSETTENTPETESALAKRLRAEEEKTASIESKGTENPANESFESYQKAIDALPKERIKFDTTTAKYYIPHELHDRAASLYVSKPTKFIAVLGALIVLAVVAYHADTIIEQLSDFAQKFIESLKPNDTIK